jgi:hypothetical protein
MRTSQQAALVEDAVAGRLLASRTHQANAERRESLSLNLSGRWTLNRELSEAELEWMHPQDGGHSSERHGGGGFRQR